MSHHLDAVEIRADGRLNLTDLYVYPGPVPETTVLVLAACPDAGKTSPAAWHPDAAYEIHIDAQRPDEESVRLRILPTQTGDGHWGVSVRRLTGRSLPRPADTPVDAGDLLGTGDAGAAFDLRPGGRAWAGLAADPFAADAAGYFEVIGAVHAGRPPDLTRYGATADFVAERDVVAAVVEVPDRLLPSGRVALWATITVREGDAARQVSRWGLPNVNVHIPRGADEIDEINAGHPSEDAARWRPLATQRIAATVRAAATAADPEGYGAWLAERLFPQVLPFTVGTPAQFGLFTTNGRALHDDGIDVALSWYLGRAVDDGISPARAQEEFPYLRPPHLSDVPPLAG